MGLIEKPFDLTSCCEFTIGRNFRERKMEEKKKMEVEKKEGKKFQFLDF